MVVGHRVSLARRWHLYFWVYHRLLNDEWAESSIQPPHTSIAGRSGGKAQDSENGILLLEIALKIAPVYIHEMTVTIADIPLSQSQPEGQYLVAPVKIGMTEAMLKPKHQLFQSKNANHQCLLPRAGSVYHGGQKSMTDKTLCLGRYRTR